MIRIAATCFCGSDLWPYRGLQPVDEPAPMGHEYYGVVEEVGSAVKSIKPGQFVIGSFATSDNTCPHCHYGYQSSCVHREFISRAQAPVLRVPEADGTLVPTPTIDAANTQPRVAPAGERTIKGKGSLPDCGTGIGRTALAHSEPVTKTRYFHHQPRWGATAIGPIAHAVEDDDQIETWMIGQGQEPSGNRYIIVRRAWDRC